MIDNLIVVKRYAEAFVGYLKESIGLEKGLDDLKRFKSVAIRDNPDFLQFLETPEIAFNEKCDFIDRVLDDDFVKEIAHLLKLLLEKGRINDLVDILDYIIVNYSHEGQTEVLLKTSFPLDLDLIKEIEEGLEKKMQKKLRFYIDLDGSLLGGVKIIMGNTVIDGSVRKRLDDLREKLLAVNI